jgi:hypothetical protein
MEREVQVLIDAGYSDVYIEAVIYGKYKHKHNIKEISNKIKELRDDENEKV